MDLEEAYLKKRFIDLSKRAEDKNIITFSHFLNLNELNIFHQIKKDLYSSFQTFGGYDCAERQMVAFIPDALSYVWDDSTENTVKDSINASKSIPYPIITVAFTPSHPKFAESLTHRDVLGALMHLGIKRETLGDILILDNQIIVFCTNSIADYMIEQCSMIRHTNVTASQIAAADFHYEPKWIEKEGVVSSLRLDTIIADVCKLPRSAAQKIISEGNAFINAKRIQQNTYNCQNGDILSVRHVGKFQIETTGHVTKKGRIRYRYKIYA